MITPTRPVLRYHGGKWKLGKWIISHFPAHRVYVEPYGGAASVLLQKSRTYAEIYNDLDGEIVNVFRVLRNPTQARELVRLLRLTPFAREEFEISYLPDGDPVEAARRTIVRSFMGFCSAGANGRSTGFRNNAHRSGTTPSHDWANYPAALEFAIARLSGVVIENRNALDLITQMDRDNVLFYCDPPYMHETRYAEASAKTYMHEMADQDHADLAHLLHGIDGMAIVSGYRCDLYDHLYADWQRVDQKAHADGARKRTESLWIKPNTIVRPTLFD